MENFSDILWVLLIAGSILISIVAKNKEAKRKKSTESMPGPADQPETPYSKTSQSVAELLTDIHTHSSMQKHAIKQPESTQIPSSGNAADPDAGQSEEPEGHSESISDDFDLRKAVIWSEILNPKFDEHTH